MLNGDQFCQLVQKKYRFVESDDHMIPNIGHLKYNNQINADVLFFTH